MFWFKKMIETVNQNGIRNYNVEKVDTKNFFEAVEKCYSFVFSVKTTSKLKELSENSDTIDLPFSCISIELNGKNTLTRSHGRDVIKDNGCDAKICCLLVSENEKTKSLNLYILMELSNIFQDKDSLAYQVYYCSNENDPNFSLVNHYLKRINEETEGLEKTRQKIKIGSGKTKRFHTIRKIIHIRPKSKKSYDKDLYEGKTIDFSHRFVRRGHWRKLDEGKIGKNREGDYCESGRTWVNDSKPIGPEEKPLIKKVRVVDN